MKCNKASLNKSVRERKSCSFILAYRSFLTI